MSTISATIVAAVIVEIPRVSLQHFDRRPILGEYGENLGNFEAIVLELFDLLSAASYHQSQGG